MRAFLNDFAPLSEKEMYDRYAESPLLLLLLLATATVPTWWFLSIPLLQVIQGGAANGRLCRGVKKSAQEFLPVCIPFIFLSNENMRVGIYTSKLSERSQSEHFVFL
jgi:hypothetical protein